MILKMSLPQIPKATIIDVDSLRYRFGSNDFILKNARIKLYFDPNSSNGLFRIVSYKSRELCDI